MLQSWLAEFSGDVLGAGGTLAVLAAYHAYLRVRLRHDPLYTVQAVNAMARSAWVANIMQAGNKDILAVQTLRNAIMGPTFLASTAILLIIGTLTLSGQGEKLSQTWHAINVFGAKHEQLWIVKLMLLQVDFFVAFFAFSMAIRMFIHVGFMINVPLSASHRAISADHVATHLNRAGTYHSIGMRAYYLSVPLVFWLFGPHLMFLAAVVLVAFLYHVDRAPKILHDDYE